MNQQQAAEKTIRDLNEQLYKAYARIKELQDKVDKLESTANKIISEIEAKIEKK